MATAWHAVSVDQLIPALQHPTPLTTAALTRRHRFAAWSRAARRLLQATGGKQVADLQLPGVQDAIGRAQGQGNQGQGQGNQGQGKVRGRCHCTRRCACLPPYLQPATTPAALRLEGIQMPQISKRVESLFPSVQVVKEVPGGTDGARGRQTDGDQGNMITLPTGAQGSGLGSMRCALCSCAHCPSGCWHL